jgi:circadian clock protein KaiC
MMESISDLSNPPEPAKASTGIHGLDVILNGGLSRQDMHLLQGGAGTGKTTAALQFLLAGRDAGETTLYLTISQAEQGLARIAYSHGWTLEGLHVHELLPKNLAEQAAADQTIFPTADVEFPAVIATIQQVVERVKSARVVLDSLAELSLLSGEPLRYRRQLLGLRQFFAEHECTVLLLNAHESEGDNYDIQDMVNGVIALEQSSPVYGNVRRRLRIVKLRGATFHGGYYNFKIRTGGLEVYPHPKHEPGREHGRWGPLESGIQELESMLGGGLEAGSTVMVLGPTGTGKTTFTTLYAFAVAQQGLPSAFFLFAERPETFYQRSEGLGVDLRPFAEQGLISVRRIEAGSLSPGEFLQQVKQTVDKDGVKVVVIDGITGYFHAMPHEEQLVPQLNELLAYLGEHRVLSFLVVSQRGIVGSEMESPVDISYMADSVVVMRHFEAAGELRQAISVVKKRYGPHEHTLREIRFSPGSVTFGEPIREFSGILAGSPTLHLGKPDSNEQDGSDTHNGEG